MSSIEIYNYLKKSLGIIIKHLEEAGVVSLYPYTSRFSELRSQTIGSGEWFTALQCKGMGRVDEFLIRSPSVDIEVQVVVDGESILERSYGELREIQQVVKDISAFEELDENGDPTGFYIISLRNIPFSSSVQIRVKNIGAKPITLPNIFMKYRLFRGG